MTAPNPSDSPCATTRGYESPVSEALRDIERDLGIHGYERTPRFPLVEAMGVPVRAMSNYYESKYVVYADDLEAALAKNIKHAVVREGWRVYVAPECLKSSDKSLRAVVIELPEPMPDTVEGLLRELCEEWQAGRVYAPSDRRNLYDRARKLLGKG